MCSSSFSAYLYFLQPQPLTFTACSIFPPLLPSLLFIFLSLFLFTFITHILLFFCLLFLPSFPGWKHLLSFFFLFFASYFLSCCCSSFFFFSLLSFIFLLLPRSLLLFSSSSISLRSRPPRLDPLPGSCVGWRLPCPLDDQHISKKPLVTPQRKKTVVWGSVMLGEHLEARQEMEWSGRKRRQCLMEGK